MSKKTNEKPFDHPDELISVRYKGRRFILPVSEAIALESNKDLLEVLIRIQLSINDLKFLINQHLTEQKTGGQEDAEKE